MGDKNSENSLIENPGEDGPDGAQNPPSQDEEVDLEAQARLIPFMERALAESARLRQEVERQ
jgi:hypothetical protein